MKLTKFEVEKMDIKEMSEIKAGSGESECRAGYTKCTGSDKDNNAGDSD